MRVPCLIPEQADMTPAADAIERKKRRGATAMEYLFMASLVLVALIIGAQQVGLVTGKIMKNNADATTFDHIHRSKD